jgi:hypothetical protein
VSGWTKFIDAGRQWVENHIAQQIENMVFSNHNDASFTTSPYVYNRSIQFLSFNYEFRGDDYHENLASPGEGPEHYGKEIYHLRVWSYIHAVIFRSAFSTYIFPYVLAFVASCLLQPT